MIFIQQITFGIMVPDSCVCICRQNYTYSLIYMSKNFLSVSKVLLKTTAGLYFIIVGCIV